MSPNQSPSAASTRRYVTVLRDDSRSGYDFPGIFMLEFRRDGTRARLTQGGFGWSGNQGGYEESVTYLTREQGRKLLRRCRFAVLHAARGEGDYNCSYWEAAESMGL